MMYYVPIILGFFACVSGAPGTGSNRIAGGDQVDIGKYPFVVSISYDDAHICGGFIYNDRWVVTAASCVVGREKEKVKVTVGAISLINPDPEEQKIEVFSNTTYPEYNSTTKLHDIALVELARPIVFGSTAKALRYDEVDNVNGWDNEIVGWGATEDGALPSTRLRSGKIGNITADCKAYGIDAYNKNYMICAGNNETKPGTPDPDPSTLVSPCEYDEGTPLTQLASYTGKEERIIVGIMSKNQGCLDLKIPSIYTRLSAYYSWLLKIAGQQPAPSTMTATKITRP